MELPGQAGQGGDTAAAGLRGPGGVKCPGADITAAGRDGGAGRDRTVSPRRNSCVPPPESAQ